MKAMVLIEPHQPLQLLDIPKPIPTKQQIQIKVQACGVCRTDLHIIDGELTHPHLPLVLGHQIVGYITEKGSEVKHFQIGDRVGVPWLGGSCGHCPYCLSDQENLCDNGVYTGYQINGGFAEYCVAHADFIFPIPASYPSLQAAPLLCGGLIGYRAYRITGNSKRLGLYGFGSAAHILTQLAVYQDKEVFAFTRADDKEGQTFALSLGATWAGASSTLASILLDAAIIFAPDGALVPLALQNIRKGGIVVCAGIHMSEIPAFSYDLLYGERILQSVTNLTREDGKEFLALAPQVPIHTTVHSYSLAEANRALDDLRAGRIKGSAVIEVEN